MTLPHHTVKGILGVVALNPAITPYGDSPPDLGGTLPAGTMVGDYRIDQKLAEGGMASVYMATHPIIQKRVAVKVMVPELCRDAVSVARFLQEAQAVNQIGHPNIVDVFALGQLPDGRNYLVMELLIGQSLATRLSLNPLSLAETLEILDQVLDALEAAHAMGIIHRDLKPDNIFIEPGRKGHLRAKLIDFGILKLMDGKRIAGLAAEQTRSGLVIGTPHYMAPEQARGEEVNAAVDIYSLGVMAFEMLLGQRPFEAPTAVELLAMQLHTPPPSPTTLWPEIPPTLEALLLAMLAKSAAERPTLEEVVTGLAAVRAALPVSTLPSGPGVHSGIQSAPTPAPPVAHGRARRSWVVACTALAFGVGLVAIGAAARSHRTKGTPGMPGAPSVSAQPPAFEAAVEESPAPVAAPPVASPRAPAAATHDQGALVVSVDTRARVEVDGVAVGRGVERARAEVKAAGKHLLVVSAPHYRTYRHSVTVAAGQAVEVSVRLVPLAAARTAAPRDDYMLDPFGAKR